MNEIDNDDKISDDSVNDMDKGEEWDDNYGEESDSTEEIVVPKIKRKWRPGEKEKFKEKEAREIVKSNLNYENKKTIDKVDNIAGLFIKENGKNKHRDHFFPFMIDTLGYKIGAEIGVDKGEFSNHILNKSHIEKYYCIDTWQDDFGSDCKPGFYDKDGNKRYEAALAVLKDSVQSERVIMMRMPSLDAADRIEDNYLDYVYIDGDHSLEGIVFDLYKWTYKVKIGGMIAGHDYKDGPRSGINNYFGKQLDYKVKTAVDYFCDRYGYKLNITGGRILSWWFIRNR